ncbi:nitroreductase [Salinibius halmophilus]|uniref:nitroreductase n=1 Tax=Salinibius halmophilus TaxID=1853216 RepID=UPI000E674DA6|nr:nitroreductase [Salinibius halmophilus]
MISVSQALNRRRSIRSFTDQPVARATIEQILATARLAPSGGNIQPGFCHVLSDTALSSLVERLQVAARQQDFQPTYQYYPEPLSAPYKKRVMGAAKALYASLAIDRLDKHQRLAQQLRNYAFHGAPVGIIVTIDKQLAAGSWVDLGAFIQSIMLLATEQGLATCAIGALAPLDHVIKQQLALPDNQQTFCGIALGYASDHPVNSTATSRIALSEFSQFYSD